MKKLLNRIIDTVIKSWKKTNDNSKMYYSYTLIFIVVFLISFSPFFFVKSSFICQFDGRETIIQSLIYTGKWMREIITNILNGDFIIPMYDFSLGWGSKIFGQGVDPLELVLAPFFTATLAEILYSILIILRLYFAGLSYLYMCHYFGKSRTNTLAGCVVYLFSAYMIYAGLAFPAYITPMIQLPLLVVGAERVMRKERSIGFIFTVMYTAICGYYHLYIQTILIGIYCVVRLFALYDKGKRLEVLPGILGRGIGKWLMGFGMSAFIMVPAMLGFTAAGRSDFNNISISGSIATHWHYFWVRLMSLISPINHYDWDWGMDYPAYAAVFLICAVVIYTAGNNDKSTQKWLLSIGLFMLFCPWCGLVMNGFQYPCNRWSFGLSLLAGFLVTDSLPDLFRIKNKQKAILIFVVVVYGCVGMLFAGIKGEVCTSVGTAFLVLTLLVVLISSSFSKGVKRLKPVLCLSLICLNVCVNAIFLNISMGWVYWFLPMEYATDRVSFAVEGEPSHSPYGYEVSNGRIDSTYLFYNDSVVYEQPGTNIYNALVNGNIVEFWNATEGSGNVQYFKIYSSDQRTILNSLLSVDQQFEREETVQYVPYGYSYLGDISHGLKVFQNDFSLGWGYTYDKSVSYDAVKDLNGIDMQEVMLRSVILNSDKQISTGSLETGNKRIPYTIQCNGCAWEDGVLTVNDGGGVINLNADLPAGQEYYVRIKGFNIDNYGDDFLTISTNASFDITVESGGISKYSRAMAKSYPWYYGREDYLFCLGYQEEDRDCVQFKIPKAGTFKLDDIELYALPIEEYPEQVEKLRKDKLENVKLDTNELSGTIEVSGNKVLCITVPYENGWTAYVDGQETEILRANYAFMGLNLTDGHHDIVLKYHVPYLDIGVLISIICLCITAFIYLILRNNCGEKNLNETELEKTKAETES